MGDVALRGESVARENVVTESEGWEGEGAQPPSQDQINIGFLW